MRSAPIALALLAASSAVAQEAATMQERAAAADGAALYERQCAICHRAGGTGAMMLERRLGAERSLLAARGDLAPDYVGAVVRGGLMSMPRFTRVELTDAELAAITQWLAAVPHGDEAR